ncbi:MAG: esterase-like activity of phytase family protein, partial [Pseudomonadota bacterium]
EGLVAIPARNLLVTANEVDLVEDGGVRSHVMIYELQDGDAVYPTLVADDGDKGLPIGWGALSGLVADAETPGRLYAVTDSFYGDRPQILVIDATADPARITDGLVVTRNGEPASALDLEGIALAEDGGFWLASEGRTDRDIPHAILKVDDTGAIVEEVSLPEALLANEIRFGFEGVTTIGTGDELTLWMAVQREWEDDPKGLVKLVAYTPSSGEWGAVHYPLEAAETGWVGLSEITAAGDIVYIVERDNQIGSAARIKQLYAVPTASLTPAALGGELPVVEKTLVRDFLPDLQAWNGYVQDKVEGFAIDADGNAFAVTDNDGVDDASGETFFMRLGQL